jgi:prophage regulatory protein
MQPMSYEQLLRITEVSSLTTIAKSTINLWVVQGKFPKPITLSPTIKVWKLQSLRDWIDSQSVEEVIEFNAVNSNQSGELK